MKSKTIARFAMLTALALVLGYVEAMIPVTPGIPGIKLGLGNAVLIFAVYTAAPLECAMLMFCKVFLSSFLFGGGFSALLYSLAGGVLSLLVMLLLSRMPKLGVIGVSACGAVTHNLGQLSVASLMLGSGAVWAYFPALMLSGIIMGPVIGIVAQSVFHSLKRTGTEFVVQPRAFKDSRIFDCAVIAVVLAAAGVVWFFQAGSTLRRADAGAEYYAEITQNGRVLYEIPMTQYGSYTMINRYTDGENCFVIDTDGVHMSAANCPDKVCINQGTISAGTSVPVCCLPNLLTLQVIPAAELPEGFEQLNCQPDE